LLGGPVQPPAATGHSALLLLAILLALHVTHVLASEMPGLTWRPWLTCNLALHVVYFALAVLPLPILQPESRASLVRTLVESIIAPFAPVTFWHVIVADYLTSMAKAFSDMQMTCCISAHIFGERPAGAPYVSSTELWNGYEEHCADTYANAIMLGLPFCWRLMQCLKVYSKTKERKNLWNALKYSTAFPLVYSGYMRRHAPSLQHDRLFIAAATIQSSYTFVWDLLMDWGLPRCATATHGGAAMRCNLRLREQLIVSPHKHVYLVLCSCNFLLRFAWTLSIFGRVPSRGAFMFFFEVIEIMRRTVWAIFRIEWEVIAKGIGPQRVKEIELHASKADD